MGKLAQLVSMKKDTPYHDFVVYDLMAKLPSITSRPMMSGWAIYTEGVVFAAIIGNQLYFKAKEGMAEYLASLGWTKFNYEKKNGKVVSMSYWLVPEEMVDDQEAFDMMAFKLLGL